MKAVASLVIIFQRLKRKGYRKLLKISQNINKLPNLTRYTHFVVVDVCHELPNKYGSINLLEIFCPRKKFNFKVKESFCCRPLYSRWHSLYFDFRLLQIFVAQGEFVMEPQQKLIRLQRSLITLITSHSSIPVQELCRSMMSVTSKVDWFKSDSSAFGK